MFINRASHAPIVAFVEGRKKQNGKTGTDGHALYLFGNMIAKRAPGGIVVTLAGWDTKSTRGYLNNLFHYAKAKASIHRDKGETYLNGEQWGGAPTFIACDLVTPTTKEGDVWALGTAWIASDGWRGYDEPFAAICGANDTGMWSDSPCRSDVAKRELGEAQAELLRAGIRTRLVTAQSSNAFCVHHYLVGKVMHTDKGREVVKASGLADRSTLLYVAGR